MNEGENGAGRVAVLELGGKWMCKKVALSTPSITPGTPRICLICITDTHNTHWRSACSPRRRHSHPLRRSYLSGTDHDELDDALTWLNSYPHPYNSLSQVNHDVALTSPERRRIFRTHLFTAAPIHPSWPFQYPRVHLRPINRPSPEAHEIRSHILSQTDILITHAYGPPFAHLDTDGYGCYALLSALWHVRLRLHVFGHIHAGRGNEHVRWDQAQRAYEDVCAGQANWGGLVKLLWYKLTAWLWKRFLGDRAGPLRCRTDQKKGAIIVEI
ncbi:metallophosphoesterase domain-containing protein 1 [Russula emetica]|nr:metallophosphoesterase domain-containing protein 1 [Russula emetica]